MNSATRKTSSPPQPFNLEAELRAPLPPPVQRDGLPDNSGERVPTTPAEAAARFDCGATRARQLAGAHCAARWRNAEAREVERSYGREGGWQMGGRGRADMTCVGCPAGAARARLVPEGAPTPAPDLSLVQLDEPRRPSSAPPEARPIVFTRPRPKPPTTQPPAPVAPAATAKEGPVPKTSKGAKPRKAPTTAPPQETPAAVSPPGQPADERPRCTCGRARPGRKPAVGWPAGYQCADYPSCPDTYIAARQRRRAKRAEAEQVRAAGRAEAEAASARQVTRTLPGAAASGPGAPGVTAGDPVAELRRSVAADPPNEETLACHVGFVIDIYPTTNGTIAPSAADVDRGDRIVGAHIACWDEATRLDVAVYCLTAHLEASDNPDVKAPPRPAVLDALDTALKRAALAAAGPAPDGGAADGPPTGEPLVDEQGRVTDQVGHGPEDLPHGGPVPTAGGEHWGPSPLLRLLEMREQELLTIGQIVDLGPGLGQLLPVERMMAIRAAREAVFEMRCKAQVAQAAEPDWLLRRVFGRSSR